MHSSAVPRGSEGVQLVVLDVYTRPVCDHVSGDALQLTAPSRLRTNCYAAGRMSPCLLLLPVRAVAHDAVIAAQKLRKEKITCR